LVDQIGTPPINFAATSHPGKCWRFGHSRKLRRLPAGADAGLCKLDGPEERCQKLREFALFGAKKWRHSPKVINIGQRRRVAIPYRSSIMFIMNVVAETATEFAVCLYDCGHDACAQGHAIAVSFCRPCHKGSATAKTSTRTLRELLATSIARASQKKSFIPCSKNGLASLLNTQPTNAWRNAFWSEFMLQLRPLVSASWEFKFS
jgi:hypothetical protein